MINGRGDTIPILRFEVEGMKHSMLLALSNHAVEMDKLIRDAVEQFCTEENLQRVLNEATNRCLKAAIDSEIEQFFRYGKGREAVKRAVAETLDKRYGAANEGT